MHMLLFRDVFMQWQRTAATSAPESGPVRIERRADRVCKANKEGAPQRSSTGRGVDLRAGSHMLHMCRPIVALRSGLRVTC